MKKRIYRRIALLISLIMLITSSVQTTYGFIIVKTDTLVNTFVPGASVASFLKVTGTKNLVGRSWMNEEFTFKLDEQTGLTDWENRGTEVVSYQDADKTFDFSSAFQSIVMNTPGVYSFVVYEVDESSVNTGIIYDTTQYPIEVETVLDPATGLLAIHQVRALGATVVPDNSGMYNINLTFTNYDKAFTEENAKISLIKKIETEPGSTGTIGPENFEFKLIRKDLTETIVSAAAPVTPQTPAAPAEPQTPAPAEPQTPAPAEPQTPAPAEPQTPAPAEPQAPAPTEPQTPAPAEPVALASNESGDYMILAPLADDSDDSQTPAPTEPQTPAPTEPQNPAPAEPQTPAPAEPQTPAPTEPQTPAPAATSTVTVPGYTIYGTSDTSGNITFGSETPFKFNMSDIGRTYEFEISEVQGSRTGVTYDTNTYTFSITVTEDAGTVKATPSTEKIEFVNKYNDTTTPGPGPGPGPQPPTPDEPYIPMDVVPIMVDKTVLSTGDVKVSPDGFEFVLEDTATGKKEIKKTGLTGKAFFYKYFYTEDIGKTFSYKLYEVSGGAENLYTDSTVYDIRIVVEKKYGEPDAVVYINEAPVEGYAAVAKFTNVETSGIGDTVLTLDVDKTVDNTGSKKATPKGFTFILEDVTVYAEDVVAEAETQVTESDAVETEASTEAAAEAETEATEEVKTPDRKLTAKSDKKGKASFDLTYTSADIGKTFSYKLYEKTGSREGMTYDTTVYDIQVTVGLAEVDGVYQLTTVVTCNGTAVEDIEKWAAEFTNVYHVEKSEVPKTGDGSNLPFWFSMMIVSALACIILLGAEVRERRRG